MNPDESPKSPTSPEADATRERTLGDALPTLGKTCMALLGSQSEADATLREIEKRARLDAKEVASNGLLGALFAIARHECARRLERRPARTASSDPSAASSESTPAIRARALLAELYPSEREALVFRAVAGLGWADVARATASEHAASKERASNAVIRVSRLLAGGAADTTPTASSACEELEAHVFDVLDGAATERHYDHLSACDRCRDLRHDVERAFVNIETAGSDFVFSRETEPIAIAAPAVSASIHESAPGAPYATEQIPNNASVAQNGQKAGPRGKVDRAWVVGGALALFGAFVLAGRLGGDANGDGDPALSDAIVERVNGAADKIGFAACAPSGSPCQALEKGARVPASSRVKTDFSTQAALTFANGSQLSIERGSELVLAANGAPELLRGNFVAEIRGSSTPARLELPQGSLRTSKGKVAIRAAAGDSVIEVARGTVEIEDRSGNRVTLKAGEQSRLGGGPPLAIAAPRLGSSIAWSERLSEDARESSAPRGLGELVAKKPGTQAELKEAVRLSSHRVRVRISGAVARTEIEELFTNTTADVLEGIYRFPLPPDSKIERLALEVDGKLMEGAFVERDRAAAIWRGAIVNTAPEARPLMRDEIVWVPGPWRDPALLEWQRGGRFELRIFPIPKHGSRKIVLAYTELLRPAGETRRYVYPLPYDPSGAMAVDHFDVDVQVRGHDQGFPVRSSGYELASNGTSDAETLTLSREAFVPSGDLTVEYALPARTAELSAWSYRAPSNAGAGADAPYVALALRPKLPRAREDVHRNFAIVVDSSRSMFGESFDRAKRIAARLVREIDPDDRVIVLACDSECQAAPDGLSEPGGDAEQRARRFLDAVTADGASDPSRAQALAYQALTPASGREGRIIYIGDGTPTMGPIRSDHIERMVAQTLPKDRVRVTTVAVGIESDLETLSAVARGGGGVALPYAAGQSISEAAYDVLGAAYGRALRNVSIRLPDGLYASAPARLDSIPAGGEMLVVARMQSGRVEGDVVLKGDVGGEPFEQHYPLRTEASESKGNAFVPRLYAALEISDLERDGSAESRDAAVKLSTAFNVQSRFTSLLVLESQAMFAAFGLDQRRQAPEWSGEDDAESTIAEGDIAVDDGISTGSGRAAMAPRTAAPAQKPASKKELGSGGEMISPWESEPTDAPAPAPAAPRADPLRLSDGDGAFAFEFEEQRRRRMIPMRRIWERAGEITTARLVPKKASRDAIEDAEKKAHLDENRRELTRKLHGLLAAASDLDRAQQIVDRWAERDPLDPDALTARADLAARRGDRERAIRLLGSVVDARPGDVGAQRRLERLHRWAGRPAVGCRHLIAASELRPTDAQLLADAVRCSRATGERDSADRLLAAATPESRRKAELISSAPGLDDSRFRGDIKLEATWSSGVDLDLALVDADGARFSWLGAPTRSVIMARDVVAENREALAIRGAKPGEYVIELVRGGGSGPVSGEVTVSVAGKTRLIPFQLSGTRATLGLAIVKMEPRLVPL